MLHRFRADEGMSILEVIIACAVTALLFLVVGQVLVPLYQAVARQSVQTTMAQQGVIALNRLEWDLRHTTGYAVTLLSPTVPTQPVAIGMNRFTGGVFTGQPAWEACIVAYVWTPDRRRLVRRTCPPTPPSVVIDFSALTATRCTPAQLADIAATPGSSDVVLSSSVTGFGVSASGAYRITLALEEATGHDQEVRSLVLQRTFYLRNHQ